jgi:hypothetical protein
MLHNFYLVHRLVVTNFVTTVSELDIGSHGFGLPDKILIEFREDDNWGYTLSPSFLCWNCPGSRWVGQLWMVMRFTLSVECGVGVS